MPSTRWAGYEPRTRLNHAAAVEGSYLAAPEQPVTSLECEARKARQPGFSHYWRSAVPLRIQLQPTPRGGSVLPLLRTVFLLGWKHEKCCGGKVGRKQQIFAKQTQYSSFAEAASVGHSTVHTTASKNWIKLQIRS